MTGLFRRGWWPGLPPEIGKRVICSDCKFHRAAPAGWQWDRCDHLDTVAEGFRALGDRLCREIDLADEVEDRARDNPLHPNFRRLGV